MDTALAIALIGAIATIVASIAAAIGASRREGQKLLDEFREEFAITKHKTDTLWEIYAISAMEDARKSGMVASQSAVAPTEEWEKVVSLELSQEINEQAKEMSCVLHSPYDVAIELWHKYKKQIVRSSRETGAEFPIKVYWGTLLVICENAIAEENC